jgi:hypothetical protein
VGYIFTWGSLLLVYLLSILRGEEGAFFSFFLGIADGVWVLRWDRGLFRGGLCIVIFVWMVGSILGSGLVSDFGMVKSIQSTLFGIRGFNCYGCEDIESYLVYLFYRVIYL